MLHTPMQAIDTRVYLANGAGGFDLRNCPDPVMLAKQIVVACNTMADLEPQIRRLYETVNVHPRSIGAPDLNLGFVASQLRIMLNLIETRRR